MSWQKPARIGVAVIGIVSAVVVYLAMGERRAAPAPQPITRSDAKAVVEFTDSSINRFIGNRKDFEFGGTETRIGFYEDGSKKLTGNPMTIIVHKGESRTIQISGREARVSKDENYFELMGPVRLLDSDGFWLETDRATVNRADSITHVPGAATFGKGRMTGSGVGFSYDENRQILLISQKAQIKTVDDAGKPVMEMTSGTAMLDRLQHFTTLDTNVHVVRDAQIIDTDAANGRLSANNDVVTYIELHGNARVTGGTTIESMSARDISLDYTEDGKTLEAVKMAGGAEARLAGEGGNPGRQFAGGTLDLAFAPDGKMTSVVGRENVRVVLPAVADAPPRTVAAQALDGAGQAGKGLTALTFATDVAFTEEALRSKSSPADNKGGKRTAHAPKLEISLTDDAVNAAVFSGGDVTFEETGLKACAAHAEYQPQKGTLSLSGETKAGNPMVAEEQVAIEGQTIDVALETRRMTARVDVKMWMRSAAVRRCRPSAERAAEERGATNVPRLLKADAPVTAEAARLDYDSRAGTAEFSGGKPALRQEDTTISGDRVIIDQTKGDLSASGNAASRLMIDKKIMTGRGHEIRYSDERRRITYASAPKAASGEVSLISGPDSTIRAGNIDLTLSAKENTLERMRAERNVRLTEGQHTVEGAATLDYTAADETYVVKGQGTTPVVVVTRDPDQCRQESGQSITFSKNTNRVSVGGKDIRIGSSGPSTSACTSSTRK